MTERASVLKAFRDTTAGLPKVAKANYLASGAIPVVDQGEGPIAGFTDDPGAVARVDLPVVLFGDHTRRFKYVDHPFALGADGVKVLQPTSDLDPKYGFHALNALSIPNSGYSRHFKFLKELQIPLPPLPEQRRIAAILDEADALRAKRRTSADLLDLIAGVRISELIDVYRGAEARRLGEFAAVQGGLTVNSRRSSSPIVADYLRVANVYRGRIDLAEVKTIGVSAPELERVTLRPDDLLVVEGHGNEDEVGRVARWTGLREPMVHQNHLIRVRVEGGFEPVFVEHFLNSEAGRKYFRSIAKTTSGLNTINVSGVRSVPVPMVPRRVQREFVEELNALEPARDEIRRSLSVLDELFASLQQRAFAGQL